MVGVYVGVDCSLADVGWVSVAPAGREFCNGSSASSAFTGRTSRRRLPRASRFAYSGEMSTAVPRSLRWFVVAGPRLVIAPSRARQLMTTFCAGLLAPVLLAGPLSVPVLLIPILLGSSQWLLVTLIAWGLIVVVGVVLGLCMAVEEASSLVRWVEFRLGDTPRRVVVERFARSSTIATADLRRVVVEKYVCLGKQTKVEILLDTGDANRVVCKPEWDKAKRDFDSRALATWLTELLSPAGVAVEHRTSVQQAKILIEDWWTGQQVAAIWGVPAETVPELARQWHVPSYAVTPRIGAMHRPALLGERQVYEPDTVYTVAGQIRGTSGLSRA